MAAENTPAAQVCDDHGLFTGDYCPGCAEREDAREDELEYQEWKDA